MAYSVPSYVRDLKATQWQDCGNSACTCENVILNEYSLVHTDAWSSFLGGEWGDDISSHSCADTHTCTNFMYKFGEVIRI